MLDRPVATDLLSMVERLLRDTVVPKVDPATAYQIRVACTALAIARREIEQGSEAHAEEMERLRALLGDDGEANIAALNQRLAAQLRSGERSLDDPAIVDHLWRTTLAKLAVDQPTYPRYRLLTEEAVDRV